jgi:HD-GYP domain-containing protein (c-di-GMP phosphodiesterase class II)/DNA-binding CsgD family transcriptional regulator
VLPTTRLLRRGWDPVTSTGCALLVRRLRVHAGPINELPVGGRRGGCFRLAELMASLSLATDLGMGQPMEHALRTCVVAMRIGALAGLRQAELSEVYYVALLRFLGCTANAHDMTELAGGDEIGLRVAMAATLGDSRSAFMRSVLSSLATGQPPSRRARVMATFLGTGPDRMRRGVAAHCEVAENFAGRIGLAEGVRSGLRHAFERWDGRGVPNGITGDDIPLAARIVFLARDAEVLRSLMGTAAAIEMVAHRRDAGAYDPSLVNQFVPAAADILAEVAQGSAWELALQAEPQPRPSVPDSGVDAVLEAFADFVDLKSPYTVGHSRGVAQLAAAAGDEASRTVLRRAGLVHDLGRMSVSNAIWEKTGPLGKSEWEQVRLHPYYTERILAASPSLAALATIAGMHHERLDGSGYHRGIDAAAMPWPARILAAADTVQAKTQPRPHRPALDQTQLADHLRAEVAHGRLDRDAVSAVLQAAGQPLRLPTQWPGGLTEREVEVLRLLCRGASKKQVAASLVIAPSTVDHHVRHIYEKLGVSSRAGATVFALEHGLLK